MNDADAHHAASARREALLVFVTNGGGNKALAIGLSVGISVGVSACCIGCRLYAKYKENTVFVAPTTVRVAREASRR